MFSTLWRSLAKRLGANTMARRYPARPVRVRLGVERLEAREVLTRPANLVANLTPDVAPSNFEQFVEFPQSATREHIFFAANGALWRTDGTQANTNMIAPVFPRNLTVANSRLFFTGDNGVNGRELWVSDGTAVGTRMIADINPGPGDTFFSELEAFADDLVFTAHDGINGRQLWRSNVAQTGVVPMTFTPGGLAVHDLTRVGNGLYFVAPQAGSPGDKLWRLDFPGNLQTVGGDLIFVLGNLTAVTRGTIPTLYFTAEGFTRPDRFDENLHLPTGAELWMCPDGGGAVLVGDIVPGPTGSYPENLVDVAGTLFFTADDVTHGRELWRADGLVSGGPSMIRDIHPGPESTVFATFHRRR